MIAVLRRLFPDPVDAGFGGQRAALWLLGVYLALKTIMSVNSILNTESIARGDGIPLERLGPEGARTVLMFFALFAVGQLALTFVGWLALLRYRALVPLACLLLLAEQLGRRWVSASYVVVREETGPAIWLLVNGLPAVLAAALLLSLIPRRAQG